MKMLISVIFCLLVVESLSYHVRDRRQAPTVPDDCRGPPPGFSPGQPPPECCKMINVFSFTNFDACRDKLPPRPSGPPPPPPPEMGRGGPDKGCLYECLFNTSGLLSAGKLNKDAVTQLISRVSSANPDWSSVLTAGTTKCFEPSVFSETETRSCKSGAMEFKMCLMRHMFLNCPNSASTSSEQCSQIKTRVEKCPNAHIPMGRPMMPPPQ